MTRRAKFLLYLLLYCAGIFFLWPGLGLAFDPNSRGPGIAYLALALALAIPAIIGMVRTSKRPKAPP